jgi:hypothetical protein
VNETNVVLEDVVPGVREAHVVQLPSLYLFR